MSYDLTLFTLPEGADAAAVYRDRMDREEAEVVSGSWEKRAVPGADRAQMQELADALRTRWPAFEQFRPEAPLPWVELNDDDLAVQVSMEKDCVSVNIAYFGSRVSETIDCLCACIDVCRELRGYVAYDPQLDRTVTDSDRDAIAAQYGAVDALLPEPRGEDRPAKPWWKFW